MERVEERRSVAEMLGDVLREAGVLVLVFGLLDEAITDRPLRVWWVAATLGVAGALLASGMILERRRS
jgi:hypothetical protein